MTDSKEFLDALSFTLHWEGGYVNDPLDPGGATNFGVTQRVYDAFRKKAGLPPRAVKEIERQEVAEIYFNNYWLASPCDKMLNPLTVAHFDTSVNFGVSRAIKFLQQALGVSVDGAIGPETLAAVSQGEPQHIAILICDLRIQFRQQRVKKNPSQNKFLQGWLNRDNALKAHCASLVG